MRLVAYSSHSFSTPFWIFRVTAGANVLRGTEGGTKLFASLGRGATSFPGRDGLRYPLDLLVPKKNG